MSLKLSPAVKIFAIVGVVAALALGVGMFVLSGSQASSSAAELPTAEELRQKRRGTIGAANLVAGGAAKRESKLDAAAAATAPGATKLAAPARATAPAAKPKPAKPIVKKPLVGPSGLPYEVDEALRREAAVVVVLYSRDAPVDGITFREAEAGAIDAGAGFVGINVIEPKKGRPVAKQLGVVDTPVVLVYQRPREISVRIDGFADRQTIAQAAQNAGAAAAAAEAATAPKKATWGSAANKLCLAFTSGRAAFPVGAPRAKAVTWFEQQLEREDALLAKLEALPVVRAGSDRALVGQLLSSLDGVFTLDRKLLKAFKANNTAIVHSLLAEQARLGPKADALAGRLGAPACGAPDAISL